MKSPAMTAEASIYRGSGQAYALKTASDRGVNVGVVPAQQQKSCQACCGYFIETCCHITCGPNQRARCNCNDTLFGSYPSCHCV